MKLAKRIGLLILTIVVGAAVYFSATGAVIMSGKQVESSVAVILQTLEEKYVLPEVAQAMKRSVESQVSAGKYSHPTTNFRLIEQLHHDLRAASDDLHVALRPFHGSDSPPKGGAAARTGNSGIGSVRMFPGRVAYFEIRAFPFGSSVHEALSEAIDGAKDANAFIIDLRENRGGSLHSSAHLASLFLPPGTHLWSMIDRNGELIEAYVSPSTQAVELSPVAPLYVLTSQATFSAAEYFVWTMKRRNRATIIGERTRGGAHSIEDIQIGQYLVLRTPVGRPLIDDGEESWQAIGHEPDIAVPAENALEEALAQIDSGH